MPVHHRLRFLTFPMRASRLCSLWSDMRPLRFRRVPFGRDVAFDPGGATAANLRSRSRSAVGGYAVSVKAEPIEEHKESGIILDLTRCGQRLNNRAAILQSKIT